MGIVQVNGIDYSVPQEFDLPGSLDEHSGTYRISLGTVDPTQEQLAQYTPLFVALDAQKRGLFIDSVLIFEQDTQRLKMLLATVDVHIKAFGTFYELESAINDTQLSVVKKETRRRKNASIVKSKTTDRKRKVTNKGNIGISRT